VSAFNGQPIIQPNDWAASILSALGFRPFQENDYSKNDAFDRAYALRLGYFKSWNYLSELEFDH
jgi:hypothetical protein